MVFDGVRVLLQETPSPTPTTGAHSDRGWGVLFFAPVVLPIVVVGLLSCVVWIRSEGGWKPTPWNAVGIPTVTTIAQLVPIVYLRGLSSVLSAPPWAVLALAAVTGIAVVSGAAVKQRDVRYSLIGALVGVGALAVILVDNGFRLLLFLALVHAFVAFVSGYTTGKPYEPPTEPTTMEAASP